MEKCKTEIIKQTKRQQMERAKNSKEDSLTSTSLFFQNVFYQGKRELDIYET